MVKTASDIQNSKAHWVDEVKEYTVHETFKIDSVSYVKILEKITCKTANIYIKKKCQNKDTQQDDSI